MAEEAFVVREEQLARLEVLLEQALQGHGSVVFVAGEAGAGKSWLARELVLRMERKHENLLAAAVESRTPTGKSDPFLPFREIAAIFTRDVEGSSQLQVISDHNRRKLRAFAGMAAELAIKLAPEVVSVFNLPIGLAMVGAVIAAEQGGFFERLHPAPRPPIAESKRLERESVFEQFTIWLSHLAAHHPLVLILEDLHGADEHSMELLAHLSQRLSDQRVLVIGTYRPEDVALGRDGHRHPLEPIMHIVQRYGGQRPLSLDLAESDRRAFVEAYVDQNYPGLGEEFKQLLFDGTEGNALFVAELMRLLSDESHRWIVQNGASRWRLARWPITLTELPTRVEAVIDERVSRLDEDTRHMLSVASVEGETFTAQVMNRAFRKWDETELLWRLSEELGRKHGLVENAGEERVNGVVVDHYRFRHTLIWQHVYSGLDEHLKRRLHAQVGEVLKEMYGKAWHRKAGDLTWHFEQGRRWKEAGEAALLASRQLLSDFTPADAAAWAERGLRALNSLPDDNGNLKLRADLELQWARALDLADDYEPAKAHYWAATIAYRQLKAKAEQMVALMGWCGIQRRQQELEKARKGYHVALSVLQQIGNRLGEAHACQGLGEVERQVGQRDVATEHYVKAQQIFQEIGSSSDKAATMMGLGRLERDAQAARGYFDPALRLYQSMADWRGEADAHVALADLFVAQAGYAAANEHYQKALSLNRRVGARHAQVITLMALANVCQYLHDLVRASQFAEQAVELARSVNIMQTLTNALEQQAWISLLQHDYGRVDVALAEAIELQEKAGVDLPAAFLFKHAAALFGLRRPKTAQELYNRGWDKAKLAINEEVDVVSGHEGFLWLDQIRECDPDIPGIVEACDKLGDRLVELGVHIVTDERNDTEYEERYNQEVSHDHS